MDRASHGNQYWAAGNVEITEEKWEESEDKLNKAELEVEVEVDLSDSDESICAEYSRPKQSLKDPADSLQKLSGRESSSPSKQPNTFSLGLGLSNTVQRNKAQLEHLLLCLCRMQMRALSRKGTNSRVSTL